MDIGTLTGQIDIEDELSSRLELIAHTVEHFVGDFDGAMKFVAESAGVAFAAIAATSAAIIALGNKGSEINRVSDTLEHFTGSAESAEEVVKRMSEGVKGTVGDFELAGVASKILGARVKLTADQFGELSDAAMVMEQRGLGPARENLDLISSAMITGRTRSLAMKLGVVETKDATEDFAKSLGTTKDRLNEAGVAEGKRIGVLHLLKTAVAETAVKERDFGEQMHFAVVQIEEWGDKLASQVAKSPAVMHAVDAIGSAIQKNFGETGKTATDLIVKGVDAFANGVATAGPVIIRVVGDVRDVVVETWHTIEDLNAQLGVTDVVTKGAATTWAVVTDTLRGTLTVLQDVKQGWNALPEGIRSSVTVAVTVVSLFATTLYVVETASTAALGALGALTVAIIDIPAGAKALEIAMDAAAASTAFWSGILGTLTTRLGISTAATYLFETAQVVTSAAGKALVPILLALQINYTVLTERIGLSTAATWLSTAAQRAAAVASIALGTAIQAVLLVLLPVAAAWAAWKFGEWLSQFPSMQRGILWLAEHLHLISTETAEARRQLLGLADTATHFGGSMQEGFRSVDPVVSVLQDKMVEVGRALGKTGTDLDEFVQHAVDRFMELRNSGKTAAAGVIELDAQFAALGESADIPKQAFQKLADEARKLKSDGATLTGALEKLIERYPAIVAGSEAAGTASSRFLKNGSKEAEDFDKKVKDLRTSLIDIAHTDTKAFEKVFAGLSAKQLTTPDVQLKLIPKIEETAQANQGSLSAGMQQAYDDALRYRDSLVVLGVEKLKLQHVTLEDIEGLKRLGVSELQIATNYGVVVGALKTYGDELELTKQRAKELADLQQASQLHLIDTLSAGYKSIHQLDKEQTDFTRAQTMTRQQIQEAEIDDWVHEQQLAFVGSEDQWEEYNAKLLAFARERKDALKVDGQALVSNSKEALQEIADRTRATYVAMQADPYAFTDAVKDAARQAVIDTQEAADGVTHAWRTAFEQIPDILKSAFEGGGGIEGALKSFAVLIGQQFGKELSIEIGRQLDALNKGGYTGSSLSGSTVKLAAGAGAVAGVGAAASGASTGQQIGMVASGAVGVGMAASTASIIAGHGAAIGSSLALAGVTAGIGLAVVGAVLLYKHLHAARNELKKFAESSGGFDALRQELSKLGADGEAMWVKLTQTHMSKKDVQAYEETIKKALADLNADVEKYGLSWDDVGDAQSRATKSADALMASYKRLTGAGFSADKVLQGMSGDLNQFVIDTVKAGVKIPAAMQPILEQLIKQKQLSDAAARALLGIADTGLPALADIQAAAERYGISLDDLGPKVQQLKINDAAAEIAANWATLTSVTDDWGAILDKMGPKVQDLVDRALKYGVELPASLKPVIQAMVDQGRLTDAAGDKLTDLTKLPFAADLSDMFETLLGKLDELIDKITTGVGGALAGLGNTTVHPQIAPVYAPPQNPYDETAPSLSTGGIIYASTGFMPATEASGVTESEPLPAQDVTYAATGLVPTASSKGSDTQLIMAQPGEGVVTTAGVGALGGAGLAALNQGDIGRMVSAMIGNASAETARLTAVLAALKDQQAQVARESFVLIEGFKAQTDAATMLQERVDALAKGNLVLVRDVGKASGSIVDAKDTLKDAGPLDIADLFPDVKAWSERLPSSIKPAERSVGDFHDKVQTLSGGASTVAGDFGASFGTVKGSVDGSTTSVGRLHGSVGDLAGTARAVAGEFGASFDGQAGVKGAIDESIGSVDMLHGSVRDLSGAAAGVAGEFGEAFNGRAGVKGSVDGSVMSVGALGGSVQDLSGKAAVVAGEFGSAFNGTSGVRGALDASAVSSNTLRGSVQGLGGDAGGAASRTAEAGSAMSGAYEAVAGSAETLRSKVGEIVDENGDVVRSLTVEPWAEWAQGASTYVAGLIAQVQTLTAQVAAVTASIASIPAVTTPAGPAKPAPPASGGISTGPVSPGTTPTTPPPQRGQIPGPQRTGGVIVPPQWGGMQAEGGDYYVDRPTAFVAGEKGPERATFTPIGGTQQSSGATVTVVLQVDKPVLDSSARVDELVAKATGKLGEVLPKLLRRGGKPLDDWAQVHRILDRKVS